ncbi:hypothetical protein NIIDMKKI_45430 [Mycobacterium kansasii]|uniref:Rieske domain-containing protein n=1 Tax=Mycobacterium kansasii TaxID=1768 RepID=A0A7G1IEI5_MYCKA|nr:hypothetical protein NIIDMKKI_45430 [Mycobacterium kansasii]
MIPAHIYNDNALFDLEKERLFGRAWMFMAHESEIPHEGDYVVRRVLDDSFVIARDSDGAVRAMFNMCLHRGMQLCRAEMGNASISAAPTTAGHTATMAGSPDCRSIGRRTAATRGFRRTKPCYPHRIWPATTV